MTQAVYLDMSELDKSYLNDRICGLDKPPGTFLLQHYTYCSFCLLNEEYEIIPSVRLLFLTWIERERKKILAICSMNIHFIQTLFALPCSQDSLETGGEGGAWELRCLRGHIVQHSLGVPEMWICGLLGLLQVKGEEELQRSVLVLIFSRACWGSHTPNHTNVSTSCLLRTGQGRWCTFLPSPGSLSSYLLLNKDIFRRLG